MNYISKKIIMYLIVIVTFFQIFLVSFASDSFEVKCTIEDIDKSNITIEVYDLTNVDKNVMQKDASKIFEYLQSNNVKPDIKGNFDSNGIFTINGLENKLWLIKSGDFYKNNVLYKAVPQLIDSSKIGSLEIVETKYEFKIPEDPSITYTVKKEWVDSKDAKHNAISVSIINNGVVYDTVSLSDSNNWTYQWSGLSDKGDWYVQENEVPSGYTVSYSKESNVFIITNTSQTVFQPQTGLESVLETMGNRIIIVIICAIISCDALIIGKKINKKNIKKGK